MTAAAVQVDGVSKIFNRGRASQVSGSLPASTIQSRGR